VQARPRRATCSAAARIHAAAQKQQALLDQFRAGALNLLISTAVAEEGLDLTRCALVRAAGPPPAQPLR
jgi:ERCC4-related helicase